MECVYSAVITSKNSGERYVMNMVEWGDEILEKYLDTIYVDIEYFNSKVNRFEQDYDSVVEYFVEKYEIEKYGDKYDFVTTYYDAMVRFYNCYSMKPRVIDEEKSNVYGVYIIKEEDMEKENVYESVIMSMFVYYNPEIKGYRKEGSEIKESGYTFQSHIGIHKNLRYINDVGVRGMSMDLHEFSCRGIERMYGVDEKRYLCFSPLDEMKNIFYRYVRGKGIKVYNSIHLNSDRIKDKTAITTSILGVKYMYIDVSKDVDMEKIRKYISLEDYIMIDMKDSKLVNRGECIFGGVSVNIVEFLK